VFGNFTNFAATGRNYLVRLTETGAVDTGFTAATAINNQVNAVLLLPAGQLLVGGNFGLRRLNSDGTLDAGFNYTASSLASALLALPGGDFLVGTTNGALQRVTPAGALVSPFPTSGTAANSVISELLALPSGVLLAAGAFNSYNGATAGAIAPVTEGGVTSTAFTTGTGFGSQVNSLALDSLGRVWVSGAFTTYRGGTVSRIAVLNGADSIPGDPGAPVLQTPFEAYLSSQGLPSGQSGPNDDPDGDGVSILIEYALGQHPMQSSPGVAPVLLDANNNLLLTYLRARSDVTYAVETTSNLLDPNSWTTVGVNQGTGAVGQNVTASHPRDTTTRLLRRRVTLVP
jgi:hypothetical protein